MAARRVKKSRSGFLFLIIIFVLLGLIIYAYKEKFLIFFGTGFSSSKDLFENKLGIKFKEKDDTDNIIKERIKLIDKRKNDKLTDKINEELNHFKNRFTKENKQNQDNNDIITEDNSKNDKNNQEIIQEKPDEIQENNKIHSIKKNLYFSVIKEEKLKLVSVPRTITFKNTPLTETLKSLLNGPTDKEKKLNVITNIPKSTKLLSVAIRNNIAYVNFSKNFEYNPYGKEATITQIKQIVYTTTEFSNVKSVQILINGKVKTYLGGEGITINKPISRNDFS